MEIELDAIEYDSNDSISSVRTKRNQIYCGIDVRKYDDFTCLRLREPGKKRSHNIMVGCVKSVTLRGVRMVPATDPNRWRIRAEELRMFIEGQYSGAWAAEYFDPKSNKYHGASAPRPAQAGGLTAALKAMAAAEKPAPVRSSRLTATIHWFRVFLRGYE